MRIILKSNSTAFLLINVCYDARKDMISVLHDIQHMVASHLMECNYTLHQLNIKTHRI